MTHRKRRRQPVASSTEDDAESSITSSHAAASRPCHLPASPPAAAVLSIRRRRRRGRHPQRMAFWKLAAATLLLWLCDNGHHHHTLVDAWGSSNGGNTTVTKKGLQLVATCSQADFVVNAVYLVCDSPGAYYRGSSTYRDSALCIYGDKARLKLEFVIQDSFTGASSIRLEIESGIYDQWKRVAILDDLCGYAGSNLQRIYSEYDTMTACPTPGQYQLDTYFTVPSFSQDSELHYTPDLRFRFYNAKGHVLGCATTGTLALGGRAREHAQQGVVALIGAFFAVICLFSSLIYMNYGRERRMLAEKRELKMQQLAQRTMGLPQPAVSDAQDHDIDPRYHYFNGNDEGFNGSSHTSDTSNAGSSVSHPRQKHPPL